MVNISQIYETNCFPVSLTGSVDLGRHEIKLCSNWKEEFENHNKIFMEYGTGGIFDYCNSSCTQYQYQGRTSYRQYGGVENQVRFMYVIPSNEIQISEEYLMFGINDLIGAIGGHSGLFIGFSFYGFISEMIQYIQSKLQSS